MRPHASGGEQRPVRGALRPYTRTTATRRLPLQPLVLVYREDERALAPTGAARAGIYFVRRHAFSVGRSRASHDRRSWRRERPCHQVRDYQLLRRAGTRPIGPSADPPGRGFLVTFLVTRARTRPVSGSAEGVGVPRELNDLSAGVPGLEPRTTESRLARQLSTVKSSRSPYLQGSHGVHGSAAYRQAPSNTR